MKRAAELFNAPRQNKNDLWSLFQITCPTLDVAAVSPRRTPERCLTFAVLGS